MFVQDEIQYLACNVSASETIPIFRGSCAGFETRNFILTIEEQSGELQSGADFREGSIAYLTSK